MVRSNIEIKFLTPKEMANAKQIDWRYEHVDKDNLGFADPKKNRVYVRAGLEKELTKYLMNHELDHLFELEGTDEDAHGIRHKKFWKQILAPIMFGPLHPFITGGKDKLGRALGILGNMFGGFAVGGPVGLGLAGTTGSLRSAKDPSAKAPVNFRNALSSAFTGAQYGSNPLAAFSGLFGGNQQTGSWNPLQGQTSKYQAPPIPTMGKGFGMAGYTAPSGFGSTDPGNASKMQEVGTGQGGIGYLADQMDESGANIGGERPFQNMFIPGFSQGKLAF